MLVVLPTSTCDVCLEKYAWDSDSVYPQPPGAYEHLGRPHVIACGHVFCNQCLSNIRVPRTCPLCRAAFHLSRAIRIHVDPVYDTPPDGNDNAGSGSGSGENGDEDAGVRLTKEEAEARELEWKLVRVFSDAYAEEIRTALAGGEGEAGGSDSRQKAADEEDRTAEVDGRRNIVLDQVRSWLDSTNAAPDAYPTLRALMTALPSHASLPSITRTLNSAEAENVRLRSDRDHLRRYVRRAERAKEQEAALAKSSEKTWLARISEIEKECELKITQIETERQRLEDDVARVKLALKDAQAAQSDILVQAHMQIRDQQNQVPAPPYSPLPQASTSQPQVGASSSAANGVSASTSTSGVDFPRASSPPSTSQPDTTYARSNTQPQSVSLTYELRDYSYDFAHSRNHNPLPRPPEPIPLSHLPEFARPRPGSSAYTAARALARHGTRRDRERERAREERERDNSDARREVRRQRERERIVMMTMTDSEKDRRERRRERREREVGTDSGTSKDRHRFKEKDNGKGKEKDRGTDKGTDTSATETQDRRRARTRHASLFGTASSSANLYSDAIASRSSYLNKFTSQATSKPQAATTSTEDPLKAHTNANTVTSTNAGPNANGIPNPIPAVPPDVVGGWGLERSWRASYASSHSGHSAPASRENLRGDLVESRDRGAGKAKSESGSSSLGSSFTKMRVRGGEEGKDKGKGKEVEREGEDGAGEFGVVPSSHDDERREAEPSQLPARERARHISFTASSQPFPSSRNDSRDRERDTTHGLPPLQSSTSNYYSQTGQRERERRTTLSAAPSALGLVLVPSPDGRGGYTYEYQYRYHSPGQQYQYQAQQYRPPALPPQSTIQPPSSTSTNAGTTGKESITPLAASQTRSSNLSRSVEFATLTRRATDSALSRQAQAHAREARIASGMAAENPTGVAPLHVPQPRRISMTIPEPEPEASPQSQPQPQNQTQGQAQAQHPFPTGNNDAYVGRAYTDGQASYSSHYYGHGQHQQGNVHTTLNAGMSSSLYANANPNANMSLDSALASLSLATSSQALAAPGVSAAATAAGPPSSRLEPQSRTQTLRHSTSNSSNTSASTGISLTGTTSKDRRKQLLDALFSSDSEQHGNASSNRSSFASNGQGEESGSGGGLGMGIGKRVSLGKALDAAPAPALALGSSSSGGEAGASDSAVDATQRPEVTALPGQAQSQHPRGVPSRDGRPSRGLSTRSSTTQPHAQYSSAIGTSAVSHPHQPTQHGQHQQQYTSSTHPQVGQATYPIAMAQYPVQGSYASTATTVGPTMAYHVYPGYGSAPGAYHAYYHAATTQRARR